MTILGKDHDADLGGCWQYVKGYADRAKVEPIVACQRDRAAPERENAG